MKRKWRLYGEKLENRVHNEGVERQRSNAKRKRQERIQNAVVTRRKVVNQFEDAFDAPIKGTPWANERCALGSACKNMKIRQTMCCHRDGCNGRIHHLCAIQLDLLDQGNELHHVYCSKHCMPT